MRPVACLIVLAALIGAVASDAPRARPLPGAPKCPIFPKSSHWNQRVDRLPLHPNSDAIMRSIGLEETMHADFGSGLWEGAPIGIPFTTVPGDQRRVPVGFEYAGESDRGPYPIPPGVPIEGGRDSDGDRHVIVVDKARCRLYELFAAYPEDGGAGGPAPARSGTCARTASARAAGPPRTPPAFRSCPASPATTRCGAAASITRSASPPRARAGPTSTRRATSPPT